MLLNRSNKRDVCGDYVRGLSKHTCYGNIATCLIHTFIHVKILLIIKIYVRSFIDHLESVDHIEV